MSGASSTLVDGMDWGPGSVPEGTAEADDAKHALISSVLTQDGSGVAKEGEPGASQLWRCGTLRGAVRFGRSRRTSQEPDLGQAIRGGLQAG